MLKFGQSGWKWVPLGHKIAGGGGGGGEMGTQGITQSKADHWEQSALEQLRGRIS